MAEKLSNFEKNCKKRDPISALFSTQRPPDDWPDAIDHLTMGLVANECTKLGKKSENLILSLGLSYIKIPLLLYLGGSRVRQFVCYPLSSSDFRIRRWWF